MSLTPLSTHTSSSWSGAITSSARPFSAIRVAGSTVSSSKRSAISSSESPGATRTTHVGSYTSSGSVVVVVVVVVVLLVDVVVLDVLVELVEVGALPVVGAPPAIDVTGVVAAAAPGTVVVDIVTTGPAGEAPLEATSRLQAAADSAMVASTNTARRSIIAW